MTKYGIRTAQVSRLNVDLPHRLHMRLKKYCVEGSDGEGTTQTAVIVELLQEFLDEVAPEPAPRPMRQVPEPVIVEFPVARPIGLPTRPPPAVQ